jgi:hypothetical protein
MSDIAKNNDNDNDNEQILILECLREYEKT